MCVRLQEYQASHEVAEADRCLRSLAVPFFHHEMVKQLVLACMSTPAQQTSLLSLLQHLAASGEVSLSQISKVPRHTGFWCFGARASLVLCTHILAQNPPGM